MTFSMTVRCWLPHSAVVVLLVSILQPAVTCLAQEPDLAVDVAAGAVFPLGDLASASGSGATAGFGIRHRLGGRLNLTTDFELSRFRDGRPPPTTAEQETGDFGSTTDIDTWRATVGLALRVTSAGAPWEVSLRGSIGVAGITSGPLPPGSQEPTETETEGLNEDVLALTGGVELSRHLASGFSPFLRVGIDGYALGDKLVGLAILNSDVSPSGWLTSVPIRVGVRYNF